jgi:hypothetical protein
VTGRPRRPGSSARSSKATRLFRARSHHDAGQARDEPGPFDPKGHFDRQGLDSCSEGRAGSRGLVVTARHRVHTESTRRDGERAGSSQVAENMVGAAGIESTICPVLAKSCGKGQRWESNPPSSIAFELLCGCQCRPNARIATRLASPVSPSRSNSSRLHSGPHRRRPNEPTSFGANRRCRQSS